MPLAALFSLFHYFALKWRLYSTHSTPQRPLHCSVPSPLDQPPSRRTSSPTPGRTLVLILDPLNTASSADAAWRLASYYDLRLPVDEANPLLHNDDLQTYVFDVSTASTPMGSRDIRIMEYVSNSRQRRSLTSITRFVI